MQLMKLNQQQKKEKVQKTKRVKINEKITLQVYCYK
jgi:hypothetical protein